MQWFRDRRTATKLMLSFGLLALMMGGLGFLGIRGMAAIQTQLRELHDIHALGVMHLEQANTHLIATGRAIRGLLLTNDPAQMEARRQELLSNRQQFYENLEQYRKRLLQEAQRAKVAESMPLFKAIYDEQDQILEAVHNGQHQQALAHVQPLVALASRADQTMGDFSKHKQSRMEEKVEQAEKEFVSAK